MNHREFLGWVEVGWLASSLSAYNQQTLQKQSSQSDGRFKSVETIADLDKQDFLEAKIAEDSIIVIKDSTHPNQVDAVNSTCIHAGCTVTWKADEKVFACPCHGSKFMADGKTINGLAKNLLMTYQAKLEGR